MFISRRLVSCLIFPILLLLSAGPTATVCTAAERDGIEVALYPAAKTVIFNRTAVLPFNVQGRAGKSMRRIFFEGLKGTDKYELLPLEETDRRLGETVPAEPSDQPSTAALDAAETLLCRGVISGEVLTIEAETTDKGEPATTSQLRIFMQDARTIAPVWTLTIDLSPGFDDSAPLPPEDVQAIENSAKSLLKELISGGAIYSTQIQTPKILSRQGGIRSARIVLRPAPRSEHAAFQLLRAESLNDVFRPVGSRTENSSTPLVLEDTGLEDATTYYYSVIGIAPSGLAGVPERPFSITTTGAPQPVASLNAAGNGLRQIVLSWEISPDPNVTGYSLYRSETENGEYIKIADLKDRDRQSYTDRGSAGSFDRFGKLKDAERYYYKIRTRNKVGLESEDSEKTSALTKGAPTPPAGLKAIDRLPRKVMLSWQAAADPHTKGYAIFRAESESGPFAKVGFASDRKTIEYIDEGEFSAPLKNDSRYYYRIRSVNVVDVASDDSGTVSAITKAAPEAIRLSPPSRRKVKEIELNWEPAAEPDIGAYEIYRGRTPAAVNEKIATVSAAETTYHHSGLRDGSVNWYRVRAIDRDRLIGEFSDSVKGETKPRPAPPKGLEARISAGAVLLTWQANKEKDIREYKVIAAGFISSEVTRTAGTSVSLRPELEPGEEYRYRITAIDVDGLESDASQTVSIRVPEQ